MKPVIVGESNPFGGDEYYAMYPEPQGCAGDRLCRVVMGLRPETYLERFERRNLLRGDRWSAPAAREAAYRLCELFAEPRVWVLLGRKVADAFGFRDHSPAPQVHRGGPADVLGNVAVLLPHPSGRNRAWNDRDLALRCREALARELPQIAFGEVAQ